MPAKWPQTQAAVLGAYLREDDWSVEDAESAVGCDDRTVKMATRVRRSEDQHQRKIWRLMVLGMVRASDAATLVKNVEAWYAEQPSLQRVAYADASQQFEDRHISHLRHYTPCDHMARDG